MKKFYLKSILLLCALVVGTSSSWAEKATYQHVFTAKPSTGSKISLSSVKWDIAATELGSYNSANYAGVQIGTSKKDGSITLTSSSAWGTEAGDYKDKIKITEVRLWLNLGGTSVTPTVTIGGKSATSDGTTVVKNSSAGSDWTKTTKVTFTPAADGNTGVVVINVASVKAGYICAMEIDCEESTGPITYSVSYNANGATSGTAPTDATAYSSGATVTVLDNIGSLEKTGFAFGGWNTESDGTGTDYSAGDNFNITASTTLYAKWNFVVTDGIFDFEKAGAQEPLVDYGSGVTLSTDPYVTDKKTWVAVNVTMETSGKYRWWNADKTLRFYSNTPKSSFTLSVPSGKVIVKVVLAGGNAFSVSSGTLTSGTWIGAANSVTFEYNAASGSINVSKITVTYTDAKQTFNPAKEYTTLTSAYNLDFTNVEGLKAYIATTVSGDAVQMTQVNKVPAGTGLVLKATTPNTAVNVPIFDGTGADDVNDNKMAGSATATTAIAANGGYILKDGAFHPANAGTLAAGKAYLAIAVSSAHELIMDFDESETTALTLVNSEKRTVNSDIYDLQGRKVAQPTKGLYIVNGKKVINK